MFPGLEAALAAGLQLEPDDDALMRLERGPMNCEGLGAWNLFTPKPSGLLGFKEKPVAQPGSVSQTQLPTVGESRWREFSGFGFVTLFQLPRGAIFLGEHLAPLCAMAARLLRS